MTLSTKINDKIVVLTVWQAVRSLISSIFRRPYIDTCIGMIDFTHTLVQSTIVSEFKKENITEMECKALINISDVIMQCGCVQRYDYVLHKIDFQRA